MFPYYYVLTTVGVDAADHDCGPDCTCWNEKGSAPTVFTGGKIGAHGCAETAVQERSIAIVRRYAVAVGQK